MTGAEWAAVLRIGLGLWWLESFRHKNLEAWIKRQAGIKWAGDIAAKHKFAIVRKGFDATVDVYKRQVQSYVAACAPGHGDRCVGGRKCGRSLLRTHF